MRSYSPEQLKRQEREARPNPYDDLSREERAVLYYRPHTFDNKGPNRREARDYAESIARLLPMAHGSAPMKSETMSKLFRQSESKIRKAARRAAVEAATKIAQSE